MIKIILKRSLKHKKDHLESRYKPRKEHGMVEDIPVGDHELGEDNKVVEVLAYEVHLNEDEKEYLKLPNSHTDFVKIDVQKMKTSIQVTAAKLRMGLREEEENGEEETPSQGLEAEEAEMAGRRVYDDETLTADFRKRRVTDSKLNKRITVPEPAVQDKEVKIEALVNMLETIVDKEARKETPTFHGSGRPGQLSTLTEQQRKGRKSLKSREKSGELVILASDKSGKRAVMRRELYVELMEPHMAGDTIHTKEEVDAKEKFFDGACSQILRAVNMGQDWGHEDRFKSAHSTSHNQVPSVNQLVKDHKETLKTRPVCRAKSNQTPNGPLSELIGELLNPYIEAADRKERTEVLSQEELCHEIGEVNKRISTEGMRAGPFQQAGRLIVGSSDVKSFYPSMDIEVAANEVIAEVMESGVELEGVDWTEVALFIACTMTQEQIDQEGLTHVIHKRRCNRGPRPGLTCKAVTGGPALRENDQSWIPPSRRPGVRQKKKMFGILLKSSILMVMNDHFYSFNNIIRKQSKGGAIGNSLTEKLGKLLMKRFGKKFRATLKKLKVEVELVRSYVDDVTEIAKALDPGVRFDESQMKMVKIIELEESDMNVPEDERTMEELRKIANTIFKCVQFTTECPSGQENGKVPVLDLQLYVGEDGLVKHEHYEKPCTNDFVIPAKSAHSKKMKMSVLVEEGLRRLRNCSRGLDANVRKRVMTAWATKLRRSGYPETVRHQVINEAVRKFRKMCDDEDNGVRPIHRARSWQKAARRLEKERKATTWHQTSADRVSAPLIIDPTAGELTEKMKAACRDFGISMGMDVRVIERAGNSVRSDAKSEPLRNKNCGRGDCMCCSSGNEGDCEKNSIGYRIVCQGCLLVGKRTEYEGESARNAFSRGLEHSEGLRNEREDSPLWKHCQLAHNGEKQDFSMEVIGSFQSCLERQINEAVRITSSQADFIMNSKSEFHQAPIVRVVATNGLQSEQGEDHGWVAVGDRGGGRRSAARVPLFQ